MLCPHCAKEIGTPVYDVNPTLLNPVGAGGAQVITFVANAVPGQPVYNSFNNAGCNPTLIPQIVTIPPR